MTQMKTKERGHPFAYEREADGKIVIEYGDGKWSATIPKAVFDRLVDTFRGRTAMLGTSRDIPPADSVGEWLKLNVTKTAIASYVGPILVLEGHAEWMGTSKLKFHKSSFGATQVVV